MKEGGGMSLRLGFFAIYCLVLGVSAHVSNCHAVQISDLVVVASASANTPQGADVPLGQGEEQISLLPEDSEIGDRREIFGLDGGYFHPYLNIYGEFTDNLYNSNVVETENFLTRISPGIWFALPRKKVIPISLTPHNTSPGGLQNQLKDRSSPDRYTSYALIGADFKYYSEDSELDDIDFVGEGLFRYNMRGGLSLQVVDRYTESEDKFGTETLTRESVRPRFNSNFFMATADWEMTEKLRFQLDYSNFYLNYEENLEDYKDRTDNAVDLYGYFNISEKTSLFLQYRYIDVAYDDAGENDSEQNFYYGGIKWDTTEKLALLFKAGYQDREFDLEERGGYDGLALDLQATYRYSEKTEMNLSVYRTNEETDSVQASDRTVWGAAFNYSQKFTEKISGSLNFRFEDADYTQLVAQDREEQTYTLRPAVQYLFKEWLRAEAAYVYEEVDSTQDFFEYTSNTFMLGLNLAL
jgi:hypothetical protein